MSGYLKSLCTIVFAQLLFACSGSAVIGDNSSDEHTITAGQPPVVADAQDAGSPPAPVAVLSAPPVIAEPPPEPVPERTYSAADITDLILVTGQSNALGAQTDYDANLDVPHNRAFAFTSDGWMKADLHQVWDRNWFPRDHPGGTPSNNFAFHMARQIALQDPDRVVGFILITDPGQRIENWNAGSEFWPTLDAKVIDAINQLPHKSSLDGILWHQGESNAGEPDYHVKLNAFIARLRTQSWFEWGKPFICGETAAYHSINAQLMALNNNGDAWTGCVAGSDLSTQGDGYHFDAVALREIGRRYANKYLSMTR